MNFSVTRGFDFSGRGNGHQSSTQTGQSFGFEVIFVHFLHESVDAFEKSFGFILGNDVNRLLVYCALEFHSEKCRSFIRQTLCQNIDALGGLTLAQQ